MSKLRVNDMATEFGISADEVIALLRKMEVTARTPATPLSDEQVARARARWEIEKRKLASKGAVAAPASARRRKTTAPEDAAPTPAVADGPVTDAPKPVARKKAAAKKAAPVP